MSWQVEVEVNMDLLPWSWNNLPISGWEKPAQWGVLEREGSGDPRSTQGLSPWASHLPGSTLPYLF